MATLQQRYQKTMEYILDEDVTPIEAIVHVYLWARFEWAIAERNKHAANAQKYSKKLYENLDVIELRKHIKHL